MLLSREVQELKEMIYECGQCVDVKPWTIEPEYAPSKIGINFQAFKSFRKFGCGFSKNDFFFQIDVDKRVISFAVPF